MGDSQIKYANETVTFTDVAVIALIPKLLDALVEKGIFTRQEIDDLLHKAAKEIFAGTAPQSPIAEAITKQAANALLLSFVSV